MSERSGVKKIVSYLLPFLIAFVCTVLVGWTTQDYGISADEPIHLNQSELHLQWFQHPSLQTIDTYWYPVDGHPPLVKILGSMTIWLFHVQFPVTDMFTAFRFSVLPFVFLLSFMMTLYVSRRYGNVIGCMAGIVAIVMPRVFFEAHQGAFDFPVMALAFAAVIATVYAKTSWKWFIFSVILIGLALSAKVQGLYYYVSVVLYWLVYVLQARRQSSKNIRVQSSIKLAISVFLPVVIFYVLWPYLWVDSWARIQWYFHFLMTHVSPPVYYLGHIYTNIAGNYVPWHYIWTLTAVTTPVLLLPFIGIGVYSFIKKRKDMFIAFHVVLPFLLFSWWWVQKYDGVRLFIAVFPFLIIMASGGVHAAARKVRPVFMPLLAAGICIAVMYQTWLIHPYEIAYYNGLVGGVAGAKARGFETDYWATSYKAVLPYLQQHPEEIYCVYPFDAIFIHYQHIGALPTGILFKEQNINDATNSLGCSRLILLSRQSVFGAKTGEYWNFYLQQKPLYAVSVDSVQLVGVYPYPAKNSDR